jgi:hypothetical protein
VTGTTSTVGSPVRDGPDRGGELRRTLPLEALQAVHDVDQLGHRRLSSNRLSHAQPVSMGLAAPPASTGA